MSDARNDLADEGAIGGEDTGAKPGGLGEDGSIPPDANGVAAGHTGEPSTFEPEEDEGADS